MRKIALCGHLMPSSNPRCRILFRFFHFTDHWLYLVPSAMADINTLHMTNGLVNQIGAVLSSLGITEYNHDKQDEQDLMVFSHKGSSKEYSYLLLFNLDEDKVLVNLFMTFPNLYQEPDLEFYQLLESLSDNCILGYLHFMPEEEHLRINYRSNYIGDAEDFLGNKSFRNFLSASMDMVEIMDLEFGVK